ncbi:MAG: AraC family transcriptional regulator [Peptococcaceae bacterium]|nr:AraC family transcriptional regulator [Peptococcaceae bacterium]
MGGVQFYRDPDLPFFELKLSDTAGQSYMPHAHEEYSLGIIDHGKSSFWYEGKITEVYPKTIVFLPPGLIHACNPVQQNRWQYKMLFIDAKWVQDFKKSSCSFLSSSPVIRHAQDKFIYMINRMLGNLAGNDSPLEKEANILAVLDQIMEHEKRMSNTNCRQEKPKVKVIREYLHSHFQEKVTLNQLEQVSGLNKFRIIRLFKEAFHIPPHTYQTLLRINHAKKEIRKQRAITEVALETGFYDQSHFIKVFKGYTGITPDKYQKLK